MAAKKSVEKKAKKSDATERRRKANSFARTRNSRVTSVGAGGNGAAKKRARPKGAEVSHEESEEIKRANELTLRVWESIYARRDKLRELYWVK